MVHFSEQDKNSQPGLQETINALTNSLILARPLLEHIRDEGTLVELAIPATADKTPLIANIRSVAPVSRGSAAEGFWAIEQPERPAFYVASLASGRPEDVLFGDTIDVSRGLVENHGVRIDQIEEVTHIMGTAAEQFAANATAEKSTELNYRGLGRLGLFLRRK